MFERKTLQEQCTLASTFHTFLLDQYTDLHDLNDDQTLFTAMVSVPGTHTVKILYELGYGKSGIGQVLPIDKKVLALFGKGSATMVSEQVIMLDDSI